MSLIKNLWRLGFSAIVLGIIATFSAGLSPDVSATSSKLSVDLSNGVAIRVVDKTGATSLSSLDMELNSTPLGAFTSDWFNVEVSTPNRTGYKLYMSTDYTVEDSSSSNTSTYTTALTNITDSSYTIPTLQSSNVSLSDFSTAGGSYVNRWGYSLDNTAYNPVPDHTTTDLIKSTSEAANKELVPVYIGANVNMDKPSGTYRNQLVFSAVANPIPTDYSLYFEPGTTDTVTNLPDTMTASEVAASHTFTIPSTTPTRTGYNFTGYLDEDTSTTYQPGDTVTVLGDEEYTGSATLTAQWQALTLSDITQMQQMTSAICANSATNASNMLTDTRDQNTYTVKKLADGKCWMTQNLRLAGQRTLTSSDSNVSSSWTLPAANTSFPTSCTNAAYNMSSGNTTYGNYYNWYAATAGTGTCAMTSGNATASICPKGWRLPTGGSSGDFQALYNQYASSALMRDANGPAFVLSGYRYGSSTRNQGSYGSYWSSTARNTSNAYSLDLDSSGVLPAAYGDKYYGLTVRCVAQ